MKELKGQKKEPAQIRPIMRSLKFSSVYLRILIRLLYCRARAEPNQKKLQIT